MSKRILHIHQDYPDGRPYPFTRAVSNLIEVTESETHEVSHFVLSINRTSNPFKVSVKEFDKGLSIVYWALPIPYIYMPVIFIWSYIFYQFLRNKEFDLIHGHKLTTEGLIANRLSRFLNIPYLISVRGGSDSHNINRLPCSRKKFREVALNAKHIFFVSPWMKSSYSDFFNVKNSSDFPNICEFSGDLLSYKDSLIHKKFISVLSFHQYKRKGVIPLITSISSLKDKGINVYLDIYGGGDERNFEIVRNHIDNLGCGDLVSLKGEVSRESLLASMKNSRGLLLPASNETFGMVYIEALFSGVPILYHKKTGIDGYFDEFNVGVSVESKNHQEIEIQLKELISNIDYYISGVREFNKSEASKQFLTKNIIDHYISIIRGSMYG